MANAANEMVVHKLTTKFLPFLSCIWISPNTILAAGHGCEPLLFHHDEEKGEVTYVNKLEQSKAAETTTKFSARELFASRDTKGTGGQTRNDNRRHPKLAQNALQREWGNFPFAN